MSDPDKTILTAAESLQKHKGLIICIVAQLKKSLPDLDWEDAFQLASVAWCKAWKKDPNRFYAAEAIRRRLYNEMRTQKASKRTCNGMVYLDKVQDEKGSIYELLPAEGESEYKSDVGTLKDAFHVLSPKDRELLKLWSQGHTFEEIAKIEGVSRQAVHTRFKKGIEVLREKLGIELQP